METGVAGTDWVEGELLGEKWAAWAGAEEGPEEAGLWTVFYGEAWRLCGDLSRAGGVER